MIRDRDLLQYAKDYYENSDKATLPEVVSRSIVRMSYYSMYHVLNSLVENESLVRDTTANTTHEKLIRTLLKSHDYKHLGVILSRYRAKRVLADYKLNDRITAGDSYQVLRAAERIFNELSKLDRKTA